MTVYEYMKKSARHLAGGVAWSEHIFKSTPRFSLEEMLDAAVEITRELLPTTASHHYDLIAKRQFNMILFCLKPSACDQEVSPNRRPLPQGDMLISAGFSDCMISRTHRQLCRAAAIRWIFEDRLPVGGLPAVLAIAGTPKHYWHQMVKYELIHRWRRTSPWCAN